MSLPSAPVAFLSGIGFSEMLLIAFLSIVVFGGRLPEVLRNLGRGYAKFRQGLHDVSKPIRDEIQHATRLPDLYTPPPAALPAGRAVPPDAAPPAAPAAYAMDTPGTAAGAVAPETAPSPWPEPLRRDPFEEPPPV